MSDQQKHHYDPPYTPTLHDIRHECAVIQAGWSPREEHNRRYLRAVEDITDTPPWTPPVVPATVMGEEAFSSTA